MSMKTGLKERITKGGIAVLTLHYSADPLKRPGTPAGDEWLQKATQGYPGGVRSPKWRKEMEIDYRALGGHKVFEDWDMIRPHAVVSPMGADEPRMKAFRLYGVYDHGWRNAACYLVHGINAEGKYVTLWEFYGEKVPVSHIKRIINGHDVSLPDGRRFQGNPYAGREIIRYADPQIWEEDQVMNDNSVKSVAKLFEQPDQYGPGIYFTPGNHGGDLTVCEWIIGSLWSEPEKPNWVITTDCPKLIWELGRLRFAMISPKVAETKDQPERFQSKDDHAWDCVKMFFIKFPPRPSLAKPKNKPNTFDWWREQAIRANRGEAVMSYQRGMI